MPHEEKRIFRQLNTDTVDRDVPNGHYRYLLNGVVGTSQNDNEGSVENVRGNLDITSSYPDWPKAGEVHGVCKNEQDNTVIYFIREPTGGSIVEYNPVFAGNPYRVLMNNVIADEWGGSIYIQSAVVVGDFLIWTNNSTEIKKINIEKARLATVVFSEVEIEKVCLIKAPPQRPPKAFLRNDYYNVPDRIRGEGFLFYSRYIYDDDEKTVWSEPSNLIVKQSKGDAVIDSIFGLAALAREIDVLGNLITIESADPFPAGVKKIEFAVRLLSSNKTFIISSNTTGTYDFYNNENGKSVSGTELSLPFHDIPLKGRGLKTMEDRIFVNDYTSGYDAPSISMALFPSAKLPKATDITETYGTETITTWNLRTAMKGGSYGVGLLFKDRYGRHVGVAKATKSGIIPQLDSNIVNIREETFFQEPILYDYLGEITNGPSLRGITWILSDPGSIPEWAHTYQVCRTKNRNRRTFIQGVACDIAYGKINTDQGTGVLELNKTVGIGDNVYLNIENMVKAGIGYNFSEGDRCVFFMANGTKKDRYDVRVEGVYGQFVILEKVIIWNGLGGSAAPTPVDFEIYTPVDIEQDEEYFPVGDVYNITNPGLAERNYSVLSGAIEGDVHYVQRPIYLLNTGTYVLDPEGARVLTLNEDPSYYRYFESVNPEDSRYEDPYGEEGRGFLVVEEAKQTRKRYTLKYGGQIFIDSFINETSSFSPFDEYTVPIKNSPGVCLANTENVLLYITERETISIYINEGFTSTDKGQQSTLVRVEETVGDDRKLSGGHGTLNPESVTEYGDRVWFWDVHKGAIVRYAQDGLNNLCEQNFMRNHFITLSRLLLPVINESRVVSGYDPELGYIYFTFLPVPSIGYEGETIAFCEKTGSVGFVGWFSFKQSFYTHLNNRVFSFFNGKMWGHGLNDLFNNFNNTQYTRILRFVCNLGGKKEKVYANFNIDAESIVENLRGSNIPVKIKTPGGQEGWVYSHQIEFKAGLFFGAFRQDINTPNIDNLSFGSDIDRKHHFMYNGEVIRDQVAVIEVENDRTDISPLHSVTTFFRLSEISTQ